MGGGSAAQGKWRALREAGGAVRAVASAFDPGFRAELEAAGAECRQRPFRPADLAGVHLVVGATDDPAFHRLLGALARRRGIWFNAVDDPAAGDVQFPSILRRGPFVVAVSTGGGFPGLSRVVREALEALVPASALPELEALVQLRRRLRRELPDPSRRASILRGIARQAGRALAPGGRP